MTRDDEKPFNHTHVPIDHAALIQSRETGDVLPDDTPIQGNVKALPFAKSWVHMFAGGYVKVLWACHVARCKFNSRRTVRLTSW